tara:strand:- start:451 stop:1971 length:1521 start_codon:yes stop_codon:yes gene_type:complete
MPQTQAEWTAFAASTTTKAQQLAEKVEKGERNASEQSEQIARMADDLRTVRQELAEAKAAAHDPMATIGGTDKDLCQRFIDTDGRVFLKGHESDDPALFRSDSNGLLATQPINDAHRNLIEACESLYVVSVARHGRDAFDHRGQGYRENVIRKETKAWNRVQRAWSRMPAPIRRAWDDQNGSGGEFIPTPLLASPMWQCQEYDPDGFINLFDSITIPSESVELPVGNAYPVPYKGGGASGDSPAALAKGTVGTDKLTLSASPMYTMVLIHEDASSDSIVAAFPFIRDAISRSLAMGLRICLMNGDTAATHQDAIATWNTRSYFGAHDVGSIDYRRTFKGLRAIALDDSNGVDRSTHSLSTLFSDINAVGGPRSVPTDMPILTSPEAYLKGFVGLSGVVSANDYGNRAPIASGEVASIAGHPIIMTDAMTADLNASGVFDGVTTTKSAYCILNRNMFRRVLRAGATISLQNDITVAGTYMRARQRVGFQDMTKAADKSVRYAFNLDT